MKKIILLSGFLCLSMITKAQNYNGADIDRMMYQRMQQQSQQNSGRSSNTPQRSYGNNGSNNSSSNSYGYSQPNNSYGMNQMEKTINGVYVYNNQLAVVRLRYYGGKVTHYSTSRDILNREQWQSMYPDNPHPTNSMVDGQLAREYKYKVSVGNTIIYFNL